MTATLVLAAMLGAVLAALGHRASIHPRGLVEHLVAGLHEVQRMGARQQRLWQRYLDELQRWD